MNKYEVKALTATSGQNKVDKSNPLYLQRKQTIWMLKHLRELREGYWPSRPSSIIDLGLVDRKVRSTTTYEKAIKWAAKITNRLNMCGVDGLLCEAYFNWGKTEEQLAKYANVDKEEIRRRIIAVIKYISRPKLKGGYRREKHREKPTNLST